MPKVSVENIVASTAIAEKLDLTKIQRVLKGSIYKPEQFPGLLYRFQEPKIAMLIFRSGKVICTGAKTLSQIHEVLQMLTKQLERKGVPVERTPEVNVQNIVGTFSLNSKIDLNAVAIGLSLEKIEYEPEQFPGLVYRMDEPRVVMLFFGSGKVVCAGAKNVEQIKLAAEKITEELDTQGLLRK